MFENFTIWRHRVALISEHGQIITYNDLEKLSITYLEKLEPNSVCILICDSSATATIFYVGLIRKKITTILLDSNQDSQKIRKVISSYSPNYIISPILIGDFPEIYVGIETLKEFSVYENKSEKHELGLEGISLCLTTSGSTGSSKFVKLSLENIQSNTRSIISAIDIDSNQTTITTMPMNYSYGLSVINTSLESGGKLIINRSQVTEKSFWQKVVEHRVNTISGVPYIYEQLSRISPDFLSKTEIEKFTQAGGKLSNFVRDHFRMIVSETKIKFYVMYGQTEATARIAVLPPDDFLQFDDAIGYAIPGGKLTICDSSGAKIESPWTTGEICYEGPNVFRGYATERKDLVQDQEQNPYLMTGDLGYFDSEGRYYISGRSKRIAKLLGNRLNLEEIEQMLREIGFETVCIEHQNKLGVISLACELPQDAKINLLKYLGINPSLAVFKSTSSFPRLASGKLDYASLASKFGEL